MFKKSKSIYAATIGLGFGLNHAKVLKNNKHVKLAEDILFPAIKPITKGVNKDEIPR